MRLVLSIFATMMALSSVSFAEDLSDMESLAQIQQEEDSVLNFLGLMDHSAARHRRGGGGDCGPECMRRGNPRLAPRPPVPPPRRPLPPRRPGYPRPPSRLPWRPDPRFPVAPPPGRVFVCYADDYFTPRQYVGAAYTLRVAKRRALDRCELHALYPLECAVTFCEVR